LPHPARRDVAVQLGDVGQLADGQRALQLLLERGERIGGRVRTQCLGGSKSRAADQDQVRDRQISRNAVVNRF